MSLAVYSGGVLIGAVATGVLLTRWESRLVFLWLSFVAMLAGSAMLCLSKSLATFLISRSLQGISGGCMWVAGLAMLSTTAGEVSTTRSIGFVSSAFGLGLAGSPIIAGALYRQYGYLAVCLLALGLALSDVLLLIPAIEPHKQLPSLAFQVEEGSSDDQAVDSTVSSLATSFVKEVIPFNMTISYRSGFEGEMPRKSDSLRLLLTSSRLWISFGVFMLMNSAITACDASIPVFVARRFGWNSLGAGLSVFAIYGPCFALGPCLGT